MNTAAGTPLGKPQVAPACATEPRPPLGRRLAQNVTAISLGICVAILATKFVLLRFININWDEFYFLSHVYALRRGDLGQLFQTAYTHLFVWLPDIGGDEVRQIEVARGVMLALLAFGTALLWKLAARWATPAGAAVAALAYLATSPVLRHGGSFRADSFLMPLTLAVLLWHTRTPVSRRAMVAGGLCLGAAVAISIKAALLIPVLAAFSILATLERRYSLRTTLGSLLASCSIAGVTAAVLMVLHAISLPRTPATADGAEAAAAHAAHVTLLDVHFFPQWYYLIRTFHADLLSWILIGLGLLAAVAQKKYSLGAFALSLLPVIFYRNAFPYYYVVMLAPACVLAAITADSVHALVVRRVDGAAADRILLLICAGAVIQAGMNLSGLLTNDVARQETVVAAVHRIFPRPVAYIDHSGMIASFPKANFFMSSWGIKDYRALGVSFVRAAIARSRPPLLLANRGVLDPDSFQFKWLLPEDRALIEKFYLPYWGPIRVAGAELTLVARSVTSMDLPFSGVYRIESPHAVVIDGKTLQNGQSVEVFGRAPKVRIEVPPGTVLPLHVRLLWAEARQAPSEPPPSGDLYTGL